MRKNRTVYGVIGVILVILGVITAIPFLMQKQVIGMIISLIAVIAGVILMAWALGDWMTGEIIKKNILDLNFQKCLVISSTSIVIAFTYFIGVAIAIITKQLNFTESTNVLFLILFTILVIGLCTFFFFNSYYNLKTIVEAIKTLDIK